MANSLKKNGVSTIDDGVEVIHRTDYNYDEVANDIKNTILRMCSVTTNKMSRMRNNARTLSQKALWTHFIEYYYNAYDCALCKALSRTNKQTLG